MIGFYLQKNEFTENAAYTLRTLCRLLGAECIELDDLNSIPENVALVLMYGTEIPKGVSEKPWLFMAQKIEKNRIPESVRYVRSKADSSYEIPYLFSATAPHFENIMYTDSASEEPAISLNSRQAICSVDVVATAFYLLSLQNERQTERDAFDRFQRHFSPIGEEVYKLPVVDRWVKVLRDLITQLVPDFPFKPLWPDKAAFAVALSHDVDRIRTWTFHKARRALRGRIRKKARRRVWAC